MDEELLNKNLDNVKTQTNLFGVVEEKLSVRERIGFVPISIWQPDWQITKTLKAIVGDDGSTRELVGKKMQLIGSKYSTSIFNPHLAQMIISAYCPTNAKIYDPFGGGGTRGFIATAMGHDYFGVEIRQEEVDRIVAQQLELNRPFKIICADSCKVNLKAEQFDFCYTCPPYYDLEVYSKDPNDLSAAQTYEQFLEMMKECLAITFKALKPDSMAVWVVGNFRDKYGYLRHFNGDTIRLAQEVGFKLWDELIFWGASGAAAQRAGQFVANRKSVRVHEYIIILKKVI